jgi:hypothetical protein
MVPIALYGEYEIYFAPDFLPNPVSEFINIKCDQIIQPELSHEQSTELIFAILEGGIFSFRI